MSTTQERKVFTYSGHPPWSTRQAPERWSLTHWSPSARCSLVQAPWAPAPAAVPWNLAQYLKRWRKTNLQICQTQERPFLSHTVQSCLASSLNCLSLAPADEDHSQPRDNACTSLENGTKVTPKKPQTFLQFTTVTALHQTMVQKQHQDLPSVHNCYCTSLENGTKVTPKTPKPSFSSQLLLHFTKQWYKSNTKTFLQFTTVTALH